MSTPDIIDLDEETLEHCCRALAGYDYDRGRRPTIDPDNRQAYIELEWSSYIPAMKVIFLALAETAKEED